MANIITHPNTILKYTETYQTFSARAFSSFSLLLNFDKIWRTAGVPNNAGQFDMDFFAIIRLTESGGNWNSGYV